jgi:phage gp36-like protein
MPYATRHDIEARYGAAHLETLVPADVDIDLAVARALDDASAMVNGYLAVRYPLPLAAVPSIVVGFTIDIACWKLAPSGDRLTEEIAKRAKIALDMLRDIAAGKAKIDELEPPADTGGSGAVSESGAAFFAEPRLFRTGGGL